MITPVETIADALIAFIMSLLRDPEAAAEFSSKPDAVLAGNNLQHACMGDIAAVRPVIVDRPDVVMRTQTQSTPPPSDNTSEVTNEIIRMVHHFTTTTTIDARSTIVDNSVNQSIWTDGGDLTQVFDQETIIASGDKAVAAGDDVTFDDRDLDVTVGDVSIGNETYDDSFNDTGAPESIPVDADPVDTAAPADTPPPADVAEPADLLDADMTVADDSYDADAASVALVGDPAMDEPIEEN